MSERIDIEALASPALVVSRAGRVLAANVGARALFGESIVGDALALAIRHPVVLEAVRAALADSSAPVERDVLNLGLGETLHRLRVSDAGDARLLLHFGDATRIRLAEQMRSEFVANASHELRTPLATIQGFVETLLGPAAEDVEARRRFLEITQRETARMTRLIDDLLSLSQIERDRHVRPQATTDVAALFEEVARTLAMRLESDGRALKIEAPGDLPHAVGDSDQLLQVLHNLLSNAQKYGRTGTPISLAAEHDGQTIRIAVTDEGEGIAPHHLPRLTERFYRVDSSRSRSLGGTGLGLAIVKHIVERHRGALDIQSRPGEGSTVAFTLPAASQK